MGMCMMCMCMMGIKGMMGMMGLARGCKRFMAVDVGGCGRGMDGHGDRSWLWYEGGDVAVDVKICGYWDVASGCGIRWM